MYDHEQFMRAVMVYMAFLCSAPIIFILFCKFLTRNKRD